MGNHQPLSFNEAFRVGEALERGVGRGRLRGSDLFAPYRGARTFDPPPAAEEDPWAEVRSELRWRARAFQPLLRPGQALTGEAALAIWNAPLFSSACPPLDVTVLGSGPLPRRRGVRAHRAPEEAFALGALAGITVPNAPALWALLGADHSVEQLVMVGDFFCRVWREGYGRPHAGKDPIATLDELAREVDARRRVGNAKLRKALELIRTDSWSPRESQLRLLLRSAGLPEPQLNFDIWEGGVFLGCGDICYPDYKVLVEYHGQQHGAQYARDIERNAAFRAAGWDPIEVTSESLRHPDAVATRTANALTARGWRR